MPHYHYTGFDNRGETRTGVLEAASANEAVTRLAQTGLRVQKVTATSAPAGSAGPMEAPPGTGVVSGGVRVPPRDPVGQGLASEVSTGAAVGSASGVKAASNTFGSQKTMFLRDGDLSLLFAQLGNIFRAGISPAEAMDTLSQRHSVKPFVKEALRDIATKTAGGMSLASAMAFYPDIFPPGAVGAVRAGEEGGYLWEACDAYGQNQAKARSFRLVFWWAGLLWWSTLLTLPIFQIFMAGIKRLAATINTGEAPMAAYGEGLRDAALSPLGIVFLVGLGLMFFGWRIGGRPAFLMARHTAAAKIWTVKKRAVSDSVEAFSFHLGKLTRAGLPPQRSYALAADAVPNRYHAEQLRAVASGRGEGVRLTELLYRADVFPQDYVPLIETGEMTGQTEAALENVAHQAGRDRAFSENFLKFRALGWAILLVLGGSCLLYAGISRGLFDAVYEEAFKGVPGYEELSE